MTVSALALVVKKWGMTGLAVLMAQFSLTKLLTGPVHNPAVTGNAIPFVDRQVKPVLEPARCAVPTRSYFFFMASQAHPGLYPALQGTIRTSQVETPQFH